MTGALTTAPPGVVADGGPDTPDGAVRVPRGPDPVGRAVRVAWIVLGLQLAAMMAWSVVLYHRWGTTWDFAIRYQGWWGIAHGNLDPYVSVAGHYFWQDHFEWINWPLAPLSRVWPGALWMPLFQDVMVSAGELGALYLVVDAVRRPRWSGRLPGWVAVGLVTLLLVANPWVYESISFDVHYQSVGAACFAMLACREMIRGRIPLLVLWVALCLACGDIAGTYLAAVGIGGILAGGGTRRRGAALLVAGVGWFLLSSAVGGGRGSSFAGHYGYVLSGHPLPGQRVGVGALLAGMAAHPLSLARHLWTARTQLWAYASSAGGLGLFTPWSVLPLLVLFESGAGQGSSLRSVPYENFGAVLFVAPLTVVALAWLCDRLHAGRFAVAVARGPRLLTSTALPVVAAAVLAVNALVWAAVWIPHVPGNWLRVSPAAAAALDRVDHLIPADAEVIVSQGVSGRLCGRRWCYDIAGDGTPSFPVRAAETYVVVAPFDGIESASVQTQLGIVADLAGPLHAGLVLQRADIWLFRLASGGQGRVTFLPSPTEPAWAGRTATGTRELAGPASTWRLVQSRQAPGYLLYGTEWALAPGWYRMTVTLASSAPCTVEVWDATAGTLLARRQVPSLEAPAAVQSDVAVRTQRSTRIYSGWGPFRFLPRLPPASDSIEIRVWTPGGGAVALYDVELQRIPSGRS